jgi:hypothetical protein
MAATTYDSLFPYIMIDCEGAPAPIVTAMINKAARELCLKSSCWFEWDEFALESGVDEYQVSAPSASAVVRAVKYVGIGNKAVLPETEQTIYAYKRYLLDSYGEPIVFYMLNDMTIKMLPIPGDAQAGVVVKVKTAFVPALDATSIPAEYIERFSETLIAGAKANLLNIPGKTWTNPGLASVNQAAFEKGVSEARIEVEMSYAPALMKIADRKFGQLTS